jgi:hypothetical protein
MAPSPAWSGAPGAIVGSVKVAFLWCEERSGRDVRHQLHFQQGDMVFQLQFTLLEAAQLQLVVVSVEDQHVYDRIQVAMFHVEFDQAALDFLDVSHDVVFRTVLFHCGIGARPEAHYNR